MTPDICSATDIVVAKRTYSTKCLNPMPVYKRPANFKGLPGPIGRLYRILERVDPSRNPMFQFAIAGGLRKKSIHPLRARLLKPFMQMFLSRMDIATQITKVSLEDMAIELNVTDDRIYRMVRDLLIPMGIVRIVVDYEAPVDLRTLTPEKKKALDRFGIVWDQAHSQWFPKVLYATDNFFRIAGAGEKLLQEIHVQQELKLDDMSLSIKELNGQFLSHGQARNLVRAQIFERAWNKRLGSTKLQRQKTKLANLDSLDKRREYAARMLRNQLGDAAVAAMSPQQFDKECYKILNRFNLSFITEPSTSPPH